MILGWSFGTHKIWLVALKRDKTENEELGYSQNYNLIFAGFRSVRLGLTISFRILISLKSIRFSSSSMWLLRSTLTARWAPDSLCTHMRTSPNAPNCMKSQSVSRGLLLDGGGFATGAERANTYLYRAPCQFCKSRGACPMFCQRSQQHAHPDGGCSR